MGRRALVHASMRGSDEDIVAVTNAVIAEYNTLRDEIARFQEQQKQIIQAGFATLVGIAAAAAAIISQGHGIQAGLHAQGLDLVLMAVSLIYLILSCLFAESIHRINDPAKYIHQQLRPQFGQLTEVSLWGWEAHLASERRRRLEGRRFQPLIHRLLEHIRWVALIVPIGFVLVIFWQFTLLNTGLGRIGFAVSGLTFLLSIFLGVHNREGLDVVRAAETEDQFDPISADAPALSRWAAIVRLRRAPRDPAAGRDGAVPPV